MPLPHRFSYKLAALAVLAAYTPAFADNQTDNAEVPTTELETIEVSGSINKLSVVPFRQAKSAVSIKADEIAERGVRKMDEIGRYQAGFTNQAYGSDNNTNWFNIRGTSASQSFDGLPAA